MFGRLDKFTPLEREQIIVLEKFNSPIEANIIKTKLDAHGIPCFLSDENLTNMITSGLSGGVRLHIFKKDKEKAQEIILENYLFIHGLDELPQCPRCHSRRIFNNQKRKNEVTPHQIIFTFLMQLTKPCYCLDCELEFGEL